MGTSLSVTTIVSSKFLFMGIWPSILQGPVGKGYSTDFFLLADWQADIPQHTPRQRTEKLSTKIYTVFDINSKKSRTICWQLFSFFARGYVRVCLLAKQSVGGSQINNLFQRVPEVCFLYKTQEIDRISSWAPTSTRSYSGASCAASTLPSSAHTTAAAQCSTTPTRRLPSTRRKNSHDHAMGSIL